MKLKTHKPNARLRTHDSSIGSKPKQQGAYGQGRGGRPWRRLRQEILERDKYLCQCEDCKASKQVTLADEVDHIVPISQGGTDDPSNLRAINSEHHKAKTAREARYGC